MITCCFKSNCTSVSDNRRAACCIVGDTSNLLLGRQAAYILCKKGHSYSSFLLKIKKYEINLISYRDIVYILIIIDIQYFKAVTFFDFNLIQPVFRGLIA